jgi:hypothetical protein
MPPMISKAKLIGAILIAGGVVWLIMNLNISREKTIEAGDIVVSPVSNPSAIAGSFKVYTPLLKKNNTIPSKGIGGACLVANLNPNYPVSVDISGVPRSRSCSLNSDCQGGLNSLGWNGYCDGKTKICWVRPGPDTEFCNRSKDYAPAIPLPGKVWEDWVINPAPKDGPHPFQRSPSAFEWRVVACLNGIDPNTGQSNTDCGTPDGPNRVEVLGKVTPVNYKPF